MSEISVWASMQPQKPLNIGAPTQKPEPLSPVGPKPVESLANAGGSSDAGAGHREAAEQTRLLFPNRFGTGKPAVPPALSSAASVVLAKMHMSLDHAGRAGENRSADARAVDDQLASGQAQAAFDGANSEIAQDRALFQASATDRARTDRAQTFVGAEDPSTTMAKDRAAIREQRAEDQAESMVLTAEAGGTGDRFNPTLDLTY